MIREVAGDILLSQAQVIAHGIAPQDHFDIGLARSLHERWPSMVRDYRHAVHAKVIQPGEIWAWAGVDDHGKAVRIVNLITQDMLNQGPAAKPGKATLQNVDHALKALVDYVQKEGVTSVALPRLATGVGGLDWSDVKPLIEKRFAGVAATVVVYETYRQGVKAEENLG